MRVTLRTRVRADRVEEYEQAHREVPAELTAAVRAAGAGSWTIWRSGTDLFHLIDCADRSDLPARPEEPPVGLAWQTRTGELLDVVHDYSAEGAGAGPPVVREL
ncbi:L-rhamnose mutarotase [Streptomyces sp. Wb2n-11]|uniref:L-rhamnose mutarotase n=1 Tax=Streptomyces sp. Wb2n-11 TaxID=1030533 RepID=UPI000AA3A336|nr:L-rhamnose mutarotase [Streptomyces sp. Wb2n-11]